MMKAASPNDIVTLDLKQFNVKGRSTYVLWIICAFSRFAIGRVLKTKEGCEVVKAIESGWLYTFGCPTSGFWTDNGREFQNQDVQSLCDRWKKKISFGPPYSPWANGLNEQNQASCDIVVEKLLDDDPHLSLQEAVTRAQWTHNTNVSKEGFVPLQIMTGKCVTFPGLDVRDEGVTPSEHVKNA